MEASEPCALDTFAGKPPSKPTSRRVSPRRASPHRTSPRRASPRSPRLLTASPRRPSSPPPASLGPEGASGVVGEVAQLRAMLERLLQREADIVREAARDRRQHAASEASLREQQAAQSARLDAERDDREVVVSSLRQALAGLRQATASRTAAIEDEMRSARESVIAEMQAEMRAGLDEMRRGVEARADIAERRIAALEMGFMELNSGKTASAEGTQSESSEAFQSMLAQKFSSLDHTIRQIEQSSMRTRALVQGVMTSIQSIRSDAEQRTAEIGDLQRAVLDLQDVSTIRVEQPETVAVLPSPVGGRAMHVSPAQFASPIPAVRPEQRAGLAALASSPSARCPGWNSGSLTSTPLTRQELSPCREEDCSSTAAAPGAANDGEARDRRVSEATVDGQPSDASGQDVLLQSRDSHRTSSPVPPELRAVVSCPPTTRGGNVAGEIAFGTMPTLAHLPDDYGGDPGCSTRTLWPEGATLPPSLQPDQALPSQPSRQRLEAQPSTASQQHPQCVQQPPQYQQGPSGVWTPRHPVMPVTGGSLNLHQGSRQNKSLRRIAAPSEWSDRRPSITRAASTSKLSARGVQRLDACPNRQPDDLAATPVTPGGWTEYVPAGAASVPLPQKPDAGWMPPSGPATARLPVGNPKMLPTSDAQTAAAQAGGCGCSGGSTQDIRALSARKRSMAAPVHVHSAAVEVPTLALQPPHAVGAVSGGSLWVAPSRQARFSQAQPQTIPANAGPSATAPCPDHTRACSVPAVLRRPQQAAEAERGARGDLTHRCSGGQAANNAGVVAFAPPVNAVGGAGVASGAPCGFAPHAMGVAGGHRVAPGNPPANPTWMSRTPPAPTPSLSCAAAAPYFYRNAAG
eukprot:TRINITY_DN16546_c0_g2_i1.p1 TRINITY_DN16546_c0_g2~~TRINITY_DN16546_c0_g2_i1.p1  ORF type:complete len:860 (-),score=126.49 TRINITY_DN16546_c0_g2_i1:51-2630(-)